MKIIAQSNMNQKPELKITVKSRRGKPKIHSRILIDPIPELKKPFRTRQDVEEAVKRILDLLEKGNWGRAEFDTYILNRKLNAMIRKLEKRRLRLKLTKKQEY